jgi:ubiquinone/menaquinone biosynthesis C-methylase UbiE
MFVFNNILLYTINMSELVPVSITGRELDEVLGVHGLHLEMFRDAIVYDLGCGISDLGADLTKKGIQTDLTGFDISSAALRWFDNEDTNTKKVKADLTQLPVPNESADIVIATYSLPFWAGRVETINKFYEECARVVAKDGVLAVFPLRAHTREGSIDSLADRNKAIFNGAAAIKESIEWTPLEDRPTKRQGLLVRKASQ